MTGFNLPPGCNVSDLPGNSRADQEAEAAEEWACETLANAKLSPEEYRMAVQGGIAFVLANRKVLTDFVRDQVGWQTQALQEEIAYLKDKNP